MGEIAFLDEASSEDAILDAVNRARAKTGSAEVQARQALLRMYYGPFDGYEEYRLALGVLRKLTHGNSTMAQEVDRLENILATFSQVRFGDTPRRPPLCDRVCCRFNDSRDDAMIESAELL